MNSLKKRSTRNKFLIILFLSVFLGGGCICYWQIQEKKAEEKRLLEEKKQEEKRAKIEEITSHYGTVVKTNTEAKLYTLEEDGYFEIGNLAPELILTTENVVIDENTLYFPVIFNEEKYYVPYATVTPTEEQEEKISRYLRYIPFNQNAVLKEDATLYKDGKFYCSFKQKYSLPIYIQEDSEYYVEFNKELVSVSKEDVEKVVNNENTTLVNASRVPTIAYHFIYNPEKGEKCNQSICHTESQVQSHIDLLKKENYFTLTMQEFERWIDGKMQIPAKSIMITVDDGWFGENASRLFTDNQINATIFVATKGYNPADFKTEYMETHSHGDDIHNVNACKGMGNQGGGILCLPREQLLEDLKTSQEKCGGTTAFAYPFYDLNDYAISILKEAGFTMAFMGLDYNNSYFMKVGGNKYLIPRLTLSNATTAANLQQFLQN